jgi:hypothetical protein
MNRLRKRPVYAGVLRLLDLGETRASIFPPEPPLFFSGETGDAPALYRTSACDPDPFLHGERIKGMETSKSTLIVAQEALKAGQESLSDYRHRKSPHKFTQPQLFACLVVKEFRRMDYRGIWVLLQEWAELRKILGLNKVPHFTTLCAAAQRLLADKGSALNGASKAGRGEERRCQRRETRMKPGGCKSHAATVGHPRQASLA